MKTNRIDSNAFRAARRACGILFAVVLLFVPQGSATLATAGETDALRVLRTAELTVYYEEGLEPSAREVSAAYPSGVAELAAVFGWTLASSPDVLLTVDRARFERAAGSHVIVAFAVPSRNLIVMDCSRGFQRPFSLGVILKHEACHLLLHNRVSDVPLPRWFDEGVCQWATDGIGEILMDQRAGLLDQAVLARRLIPLRRLEAGFPGDEYSLRLAYEQSKSLVLYMTERFGREGLLDVLHAMAAGTPMEDAVLKTFSMTVGALEREWRADLREKVSWLTYLSSNLYEILFVLAALVSGYAFFRAWLRKRRYLREMPDD